MHFEGESRRALFVNKEPANFTEIEADHFFNILTADALDKVELALIDPSFII